MISGIPEDDDGTLQVDELGEFIHRRRTRLPYPYPSSNRTMTRTDMAVSAHISESYLKQIEKGNAVPTSQVLERIGESLKLNASETEHLFALARTHERHQPVSPATDADRAYVDALNPALAGVVDNLWNVLVANDAYFAAFPGLKQSGNVLAWMFEDPRSEEVMVDWEVETQLTVAWLRHLLVNDYHDEAAVHLLERLTSDARFNLMWNTGEVTTTRPRNHMRLLNPATGVVDVLLVNLWRYPDQPKHLFLGAYKPR